MDAVRILSGGLREVWVDSVALAGGTSRTITTGIRADARQLSRAQAFLVLLDTVGIPQISASLSSVSGFLTVTVANGAIPGCTATFAIDITLIHSVQQGVDLAAGGTVHVISSASAALGHYVVPRGFDPSAVTGFAAPVGSTCMTDDGVLAWIRCYADDTIGAWVSCFDFGQLRFYLGPIATRLRSDSDAGARGFMRESNTLGAPGPVFDVEDLACNTKGGFKLTMDTTVATCAGAVGIRMRFNGSSTANLRIGGIRGSSIGGLAPSLSTSILGDDVAADVGTRARIIVDLPSPETRQIEMQAIVETAAGPYEFHRKTIVLADAAGEIVSAGPEFYLAGAATFDAASSYQLERRIVTP